MFASLRMSRRRIVRVISTESLDDHPLSPTEKTWPPDMARIFVGGKPHGPPGSEFGESWMR